MISSDIMCILFDYLQCYNVHIRYKSNYLRTEIGPRIDTLEILTLSKFSILIVLTFDLERSVGSILLGFAHKMVWAS